MRTILDDVCELEKGWRQKRRYASEKNYLSWVWRAKGLNTEGWEGRAAAAAGTEFSLYGLKKKDRNETIDILIILLDRIYFFLVQPHCPL